MPADMYRISRIDYDTKQLRAAQKLRAEVYRDMGFLSEEDLTGGLDIDKDDEHAVHIGAFDLQGQLVGTIRVILPDGVGLPVSKLFEIETDDNSVEISRYAIHEDHRGLAVALGLCRAACHEVAQNGKDMMYAVVEKQLLESLLWLGFPFETLKGPKEVYKSHNYATRCPQSAVVDCMRKRDKKRAEQTASYFAEPFSFDGAMVRNSMFRSDGTRGA